MAPGPVVCRRLVGDVRATGQSEGIYKVSYLEPIMRNRDRRSLVPGQRYVTLYASIVFAFSIKVALNHVGIYVEP